MMMDLLKLNFFCVIRETECGPSRRRSMVKIMDTYQGDPGLSLTKLCKLSELLVTSEDIRPKLPQKNV